MARNHIQGPSGYILDVNSDGSLKGIDEIIEGLGGVVEEAATGGTTSTLQDTKKDWEENVWKGSILEVTVNEQRYFRKIASNTDDTLNFDAALDDAVEDGDLYKIIPSASVVRIAETPIQDDEETLKTIVDAIEALQDDDETLAEAIDSIEGVLEGVSIILDYINYGGRYDGDITVTSGATADDDILLTLTPIDPYDEGIPQGELFEIGVNDGNSPTDVADAIATAVNASDDYYAEKIPGQPVVFVSHISNFEVEVNFDDNGTTVEIDYNWRALNILNALEAIKQNTAKPYEWVMTETSATDTAESITVDGIEGMRHIITGFEVAIRGGAAESDIQITLEEDGTPIYNTVIGENAPSGERVGIVFNQGVAIAEGDEVSLHVTAGGSGVVAELNLTGITK